MIDISILDLAAAYRKVKVDLFYSGNPCRFALAEFEKDLETNLLNIKNDLDKKGDHDKKDYSHLEPICKGYRICPKKIDFNVDDNKPIFSNPEKAFPESAIKRCELRLLENVPIAFHVITTLWINKIGEKFDLLLSDKSYGNRIRRHKDNTPNLNALGTFTPYLYNYKAWRDNGLKAIRSNLDQHKDVIAITGDFSAFYHNVKPEFIADEVFQQNIGIRLSEAEKEFTELIVYMLQTWAKNTPLRTGLPVGCAISAVIANMALFDFDKSIEQELIPTYYGRYVDDIIIVLENTNHFSSSDEVWQWLTQKITALALEEESKNGKDRTVKRIVFSQMPESQKEESYNKFFFEDNKTKIFLLESHSGLAFLETLERQIKMQSSEWRALPELPDDEYIASMVLSACNKYGEDADNLRKADALSIRRAMFAMKLRDFESYARNLSPACWQKQRQQFLDTIDKHFTNLQCFFDLFRYFSRIISIATECKDYDSLVSIVKKLLINCIKIYKFTKKNRDNLIISSKNDTSIDKRQLAKKLYEYTKAVLRESIVAAFSETTETDNIDFITSYSKTSSKIYSTLAPPDIAAEHNQLFSFDLAYKPLRYVSFHKEMNWEPENKITDSMISHKKQPIFVSKSDFPYLLNLSQNCINRSEKDSVPQAWIFPTRPFNMSELYFIYKEPFENADYIAEILRVMRGYAKNLKGMPNNIAQQESRVLEIMNSGDNANIRIALTNWKTEDESWNAAVCKRTDPDKSRYSRLTHLLNQILKTHGHLDYVVFPELSIPPRWFLGLAIKLKMSGISLISGIEYVHHGDTIVRNQVWASLIHNGLGFRDAIIIKHDKEFPAIHEGNSLAHIDGRKLEPEISGRTCDIIKHGDFYFGILICSELTNIDYRARFRGKVDAIFVPEWNSDIEMFSSLIEAAAYDVHAYIIQCNNRKYGDTRIRMPAKRHFERDIVKIKGGEEDYFVIGKIDVKRLRQFQSFNVSPTEDFVLFKPVPAGFKIAQYRKTLPQA